MQKIGIALAAVLVVTACTRIEEAEPDPGTVEPQPLSAATARGSGVETLPPDEIEHGRRDTTWRRYVTLDSLPARITAPSTATWDSISPVTIDAERLALPVGGDMEGPSVVAVQILLDRVAFSPGIIDGKWGQNTEKAVYWLQRREGLRATGEVDAATLDRLRALAGGGLLRDHQLTAEDVAGPFVDIPGGIYERARMDCLCYGSLREKLAERFHASPELLERLNPGINLERLAAGDPLTVPAVRDSTATSGAVAEILVSDGGHYVHAHDSTGRILYHFPSTLGSEYAPSPSGDYRITGIARDPTWHYQPALLTGEPDDRPDAIIPAGPNNPVGVVWMALSKPHYGIHGTSAPETIGYVTSHGCVRLTNWDASFLADAVKPGTAVRFRDAARSPAEH